MGAERYYFIFGSFPCRAYEDDNIKDVARFLNSGDGIMTNMAYGDHPSELLDQYTGWEGWVSIEEDEAREIKDLMNKFQEIKDKGLNPQLLASSAHGVYVPQKFAEVFPEKLTEEQRKVLAGDPNEGDLYWEVWDEVLSFATITDGEGTKYYLHHEGDLWAVPVGYDFEDFDEV